MAGNVDDPLHGLVEPLKRLFGRPLYGPDGEMMGDSALPEKDNPEGKSVVPDSGAGDNPGPHVKPISTEEFDPRDPWFDPHKGQVLP